MVVEIIKNISSSKIFDEFPKIRKKLWGEHFLEQGYFVRSVGEQVTDEVIRQYIEKHSFSYFGNLKEASIFGRGASLLLHYQTFLILL